MNYEFTNRAKQISYGLIGIGLIAIFMGFMDDTHNRVWANLLVNNFFFMALALFGIFFIAMQYLSQAGYGVTMKRIPEAMSQYIWVAGPLMLVILGLGYHDIYHWTHHDLHDPMSDHYDKIIADKGAYLNVPFFFIRAVVYIGVWVWAAHMLRKLSKQQDLNGGVIFHNKAIKISAVFMVFFAVTICTSSWDWIMSIDAHWYSTLFGWYIFAGLWVSGTIFLICFLLYMQSKGYMQNVNKSHLHDVGKWMFAISMVWSYLWLSQFLLIWYANIPEEVTYFQFRIEHYNGIYFGMLLVNFFLPFFVLMSSDSKKNPKFLLTVGALIFLGHWADVFVMVMPGIMGANWHFGFVEVGTFLGFLGLFLFVFQRSLAKAPLEIESHPYLEESKHLHY